jgi:hypothetical protein
MIRSSLVFLLFIVAYTPLYSQKKMPVVVVELFTSEGCSSCPAADELLKEVSVKRESEDKPFVALAFHVTYWNHYGWTDPYSNALFDDRQKIYSSVLKQPRIYTPQAVINGAHEFVGSNAIAFRDTLAKAERRKSSYTIEATAKQDGDSIQVEYTVDSESKNQLINIAMIEKNSELIVLRGENKNRTLKHFNVVREFETRELKKQDMIKFAKVKDLALSNTEIVLYVQHKKSMRIGGAIKTSVSE